MSILKIFPIVLRVPFNLPVHLLDISGSIRQTEVYRLMHIVEESQAIVIIRLHRLDLRYLLLCHLHTLLWSPVISKNICQYLFRLTGTEVIAIPFEMVIHLLPLIFPSHKSQKIQSLAHGSHIVALRSQFLERLESRICVYYLSLHILSFLLLL